MWFFVVLGLLLLLAWLVKWIVTHLLFAGFFCLLIAFVWKITKDD
jgi:hypothetical protein